MYTQVPVYIARLHAGTYDISLTTPPPSSYIPVGCCPVPFYDFQVHSGVKLIHGPFHRMLGLLPGTWFR